MEQQVSLAGSRLLSAAVSAILAAGAVQAADDPVIAEVTVTATRRASDIQDVPLNITAVGSNEIQTQGITNLVDVSRSVPGLFVIDQGPRAANAIIVRGLNADPISGTEGLNNSGGGTVATYVGEIPLYVDLKLEDLDRVEVLLGPQGTLYGAGTLGGAIRYLPRRPQFDATTLDLRADAFALSESDGVGSKGGFTFNMPFGENIAFRMSADYLDDPGFIDYGFLVRQAGVSDPEPDLSNPADVAANLRREEDVDWQKTWSGRAALRWQISDTVDANLTYYLQDQDVGGRTLNQVASFGTGQYESGQRFLEPNSRKNELLALEVTADLGFAELTSATGYSEYSEGGQRDQTDLLINLQYSYENFPTFSAFTREEQNDRTFNEELRLVSSGDGPFNWIAGVFYNRFKNNAFSKEFTPEYSEYLVGSSSGPGVRPDDLEYIAVNENELKEAAAYVELSYNFTDAWQVTVGGRYYDYELISDAASDLPLIQTVIGDYGPDEVNIELERSGQEDSGTLYKFNTSYDFSDDFMAYLTVSEGYRQGNSNGLELCVPSQIQNLCASPRELEFFPDTTTNYEVGVRTQWLDQRLTLNVAVYYIDWKDPQLSTSTAVGAVPITINGDGAATRGVELVFDADITDSFSIRGTYSYANAELTAAAPDLVRGINPPGFDVEFFDAQDGDRLPGSPEQQGSLFATYRMEVPNGWQLDLNYGLTAISDVLTRAGNRGGGEALPGFALHSASAVINAGSWTVALYGKNLFNKYAETGLRATADYVQTVFDENGDPVRTRSYSKDVVRPRELGVRFTYAFDL